VTKQPELNTKNGFTIGIYLPPEAPTEIVEKVFDRVAELVYGELTADRGAWDPFVVGRAGDLMRIDHDCECCPPHVYFSTSCFHGDHNYCQKESGLIGIKTPAVCKFCSAPCVCVCHAQKKGESVDG
jgi:hypothetical protein